MDLITFVIESDAPVLINKEYPAREFPLCIEWFAGNDLILEPDGFQKIKITDNLFILRRGAQKKGKTDIVPFMFLENVRRGEFDRARKYLNFEISDQNLKQYFGEFEILVNNYLEREDVFSILPLLPRHAPGAPPLRAEGEYLTAKNFVFEVSEGKIGNIKDLEIGRQ